MPLDENPASDPCQAATPWPDIDRSLLEDARPPPEPFPLDVLPDRWRAWVEASAQAFTPVDYLAQSLLAAVAAECGGGILAVVTPQWAEPLVLWQALVGGPSSGKTPALMAGRRLLPAFGSGEEEPDIDHGIPAVLAEIALGWFLSALNRSPRGATLWRDELADWMVQARSGKDRAGWLAGWSASAAVAPQPASGTVRAELFALNIVGALRPEGLSDALGEDTDDLAARFLYAWPEATSCAPLGGPPANDEETYAMLQRISGLARTVAKAAALPLEPDAVAGLEAFLPALRQQMREADGIEAAWLGKGAGTVVRLAGLLTLMHWAETPTTKVPGGVSALRLEDALRLWADYFHPHAKSVFERAGSGGRDRTARRAARWLSRASLAQVSREDIRREALCRSVDAESAEQVIERLEAGGVLRPVPVQVNGRGRPPRRWEVNPGLG